MKNVGNSSRGRSQGVQKIFRAPIRAHCAVIFAIAQLSCLLFESVSSSSRTDCSRHAVGPRTTNINVCPGKF